MPNYLVKRQLEAEREKQQTQMEILLNQRPQGTIRLKDEEIIQVRQSLANEREHLYNQIERCTISNYTERAKKQTKEIVKKLDEVDKAITVFSRDAVYIKSS
jgi:shikimate kinase